MDGLPFSSWCLGFMLWVATLAGVDRVPVALGGWGKTGGGAKQPLTCAR
jgi:hypothetical protein